MAFVGVTFEREQNKVGQSDTGIPNPTKQTVNLETAAYETCHGTVQAHRTVQDFTEFSLTISNQLNWCLALEYTRLNEQINFLCPNKTKKNK